MYRKLIFSVFLLVFGGCEQLINIGDGANSQKYPAKVGYEWEYNTVWKLEFYDSTGHTDSTSNELNQNTIVRVVRDQETVGNYNNLILFESYDLTTPNNVNKIWYLNSDSGLFAIAYSNGGASQLVLPKQKITQLEKLNLLIKTMGILPGILDVSGTAVTPTDTIQFYSPPRKVLTYPLTIGARWIELTNPFFRERFIRSIKTIITDFKVYNCLKIESNWSWSNLEFNDYVNLNSGLIQREIIADSLMVTTVTNPDSGTFAKSTTITKLVREKK